MSWKSLPPIARKLQSAPGYRFAAPASQRNRAPAPVEYAQAATKSIAKATQNSGNDIRPSPCGEQLAVGTPKLHAGGGHAGAQAHDFGAQLEVLADAGAQVVHAQVD